MHTCIAFLAPVKINMEKSVKYPCSKCKKNCVNDCVECDLCKKWLHAKCENLKKADMLILGDNETYFICTVCARDFSGFFDYTRGLERMRKSVRSGFNQFKAAALSEKLISRSESTPGLTRCSPVAEKKTDCVSMQILHDLQDRSGKKALAVSGDGSCLFNAVSVQLCGNESGKLFIYILKKLIHSVHL